MRWVWRGFAALGIAALLTVLVYFVVNEVRLHREIRNICRQFTYVDCKFHEDGRHTGSLEWDPESGTFPTPAPTWDFELGGYPD